MCLRLSCLLSVTDEHQIVMKLDSEAGGCCAACVGVLVRSRRHVPILASLHMPHDVACASVPHTCSCQYAVQRQTRLGRDRWSCSTHLGWRRWQAAAVTVEVGANAGSTQRCPAVGAGIRATEVEPPPVRQAGGPRRQLSRRVVSAVQPEAHLRWRF
jgi:hypothetical protein